MAHSLNRPIAGDLRPMTDFGQSGPGRQPPADVLARSDAPRRDTPSVMGRCAAPGDWLGPGHRRGLTQRGAVP
jgi:hypothetical protein